MVVSGYYRVYCILRGSFKYETFDMDYYEFDTRVHEVEQVMMDRHEHRDIHLETNYYSDKYGELLFVFKGSYLERVSELEAVIDEVCEELEASMDFTVDEKEIESII